MIPRHLGPLIADSLKDFPVVLLTGARQVGKSTLAQSLAEGPWKAPYVTLDERVVLDAALENPDGFILETGRPLVLDEVQRAPDLLRAVKLVVDREKRAGSYLLTGSANVLTLSKVSESLAGRVAVFELLPFPGLNFLKNRRQRPWMTCSHWKKQASSSRDGRKPQTPQD